MFGVKRYKKCKICGEVFKCGSDFSEKRWTDHYFTCGIRLTRRRSSAFPNGGSKYRFIVKDGFKTCDKLSGRVASNLINFDICVIDDFISSDQSIAVRDEIRSFFSSINPSYSGRQIKQGFRSDITSWLPSAEHKLPSSR